MQDWIEFKSKGGHNISLRPSNIMAIADKGDETWIYIDTELLGDDGVLSTNLCAITEPYEQVKQKIMGAEKADYSYATIAKETFVEHFTKEEYEKIEKVMLHKVDQLAKDEPCTSNYYDHDRILRKLIEILKEDK